MKIECKSCLETTDIERTVCICHDCIEQIKNSNRSVLKNG